MRALPVALAMPALAALARAQQPPAAAPAAPAASNASNASNAPVAWPTIELLGGTVWSPESWRGQAGVLLIWATWCPFCVRHNPHVDALHRAAQAAGRPLRVLAASLDRDPELVRCYVRERGYGFPVTMGAEALRARFELRRVTPTTVTFDRRGRLLQRIHGEMFEEDVMALMALADTPA
ncbi:MAG: TlpA family protein disulfide reductase [Burkholderiales bacterium]